MSRKRPFRPVPPSGRDYFLPFLLAATVAHAFVLEGVAFSVPKVKPDMTPPSLEVTLAQYYSDKAPEKADFLGQANQEGSGDADRVNAPTTTEQAEFPDPNFREMASAPETPPPHPEASTPVVATSAPTDHHQPASDQPTPDEPPREARPAAGLLANSLEIASLEAQLDMERKLWAKRPKHRNLSAANIKSAADAAYLDQWRRRVEQVGNLNYPNEARRDRIFGELVLAVTLYKDGTIKEVNIEQGSGQRILDDAARKIVHLAAPFAPLPRELNTDELTIIKTWRFEPGNQLATQ